MTILVVVIRFVIVKMRITTVGIMIGCVLCRKPWKVKLHAGRAISKSLPPGWDVEASDEIYTPGN